MINNLDVCIYSPSENIWGGGQIYIDYLCNYMNSKGLYAAIATSEPESFSCPTIIIGSVVSKKKRLLNAFFLARKLKKLAIKVIVLNDLSSLWLAPIFKLYDIRVVALLHIYLHKKNVAGFGYNVLEYNLLRESGFFCDKIFSVNRENIKTFPVGIEFVGNFISPWFFGLPLQSKKYDLAVVSRLSKEKNILLFIKIVEKLTSNRKNLKALILGCGAEKDKIIRAITLAGLEDVIDLHDWVDRVELPSIYDSIKCFAITSHHEGFATTLLEAHARGVPAITTKSAGFCAEFVEGFGSSTGISFTPEDIESPEFQRNVLSLIDQAESYYGKCIHKAKLFNEDKVLGEISRSIELFF